MSENELKRAGTNLERAGTNQNGLEQDVATKDQHQKELGQLVAMVVVSCYDASYRKFYANLTITETHRASTDMEFWVNSTSWR